jgi:hypothetical protein
MRRPVHKALMTEKERIIRKKLAPIVFAIGLIFLIFCYLLAIFVMVNILPSQLSDFLRSFSY